MTEFLLFPLESMQQINDDFSYARQIYIQALWASVLAERVLQNCPQGIRNIAQVRRLDAYRREGPTGDVELGT